MRDGEDAGPMEPATTAESDVTTGDANGAGSTPGFGVGTGAVAVLAVAVAAARRTA